MAMITHPPEHYMRIALQQAQAAALAGEVPIGAVAVCVQTGAVLAQAHNQTITLHDPTAHAEVLAIRQVCGQAQAQRVPEIDVYVTLEPCPMCAAALSFARVRRVVFGASDPKSGGLTTPMGLYSQPQLHHKPVVEGGVLADECTKILQDFFKLKRAKAT